MRTDQSTWRIKHNKHQAKRCRFLQRRFREQDCCVRRACPSTCAPAPGSSCFESCRQSTFDTPLTPMAAPHFRKIPMARRGIDKQETVPVKYPTIDDILPQGGVGGEPLLVQSCQRLSERTVWEHRGAQTIFPRTPRHALDYKHTALTNLRMSSNISLSRVLPPARCA